MQIVLLGFADDREDKVKRGSRIQDWGVMMRNNGGEAVGVVEIKFSLEHCYQLNCVSHLSSFCIALTKYLTLDNL